MDEAIPQICQARCWIVPRLFVLDHDTRAARPERLGGWTLLAEVGLSGAKPLDGAVSGTNGADFF